MNGTMARDFLQAVLPDVGYINLVVIDPEKRAGAIAAVIDPQNLSAAVAFAELHNVTRNLYWSPNPLRTALNKKAKKTDVLAGQYLHVDIDDPSEDVRRRLQSFTPRPTIILFSGGGWQGFWRLRVAALTSDVERYNKALIRVLRGDKSAWNLDRVMRLPGTTNWPTATKRARGRVPAEAWTVEINPELKYELSDFDALLGATPPPSPAVVAASTSKPISKQYPSRSEHLLAEVGGAARSGKTDEQIHAALDSHPHAADQADPAGAVQNCIDKVRSENTGVVAEVNREHALVWLQGKLCVMWKTEWNGSLPRLSTIEDIKRYWRNRSVGKVNPIDEWLNSEERAEFNEIVFRPGILDVGRDYNLWRGWAVEPQQGDCSLFLGHLRDVICARDESLYQYLLQWLANIAQDPGHKPGTAWAMGSGQGSGKGAIFRYLRPIFSPHSLQLAGSELLLGRFNDILAGKILVCGDEAAWPGDKRGIDKLKSYITEEYVSIERKLVPAFEIENHARFIFATNRVHSAPAEIDDRRFVVLPVDEGKRNDDAYWEALTAEQNSSGPAALLHHLLHEVKITRNLRSVPKTIAHAEQKLMSLDSVGTFWRWALQTKYPHAGIKEQRHEFSFGEVAAPTEIWEVYRLWCRDNGDRFRFPPDAFGRALKKYVGDLRKREARVDEQRKHGIAPRGRVYELPALDEARQLFEAALGGAKLQWDDDGDGADPSEVVPP